MIDIDLDTPGKRHGHLWLRAGDNQSAYRLLGVPVTVVVNGNGPTVLAMGGVHGDEYEGQYLLNKLANDIDSTAIQGRLLIVPCSNPLACDAGLRSSPEDNGNLFRSFTQLATLSLTEGIGNAIETELMKHADAVVDLHAGGRNTLYKPCTVVFKYKDEQPNSAVIDMACCFNLDTCMIKEVPLKPAISPISAASRLNIPYLALELGGSGDVNIVSSKTAADGILNVLKFLNKDSSATIYKPDMYSSGGPNDYLVSPADGIFVREYSLGQMIENGQAAGELHRPLENSGNMQLVNFSNDGMVMTIRSTAKCRKGDCLAELAHKIVR